MRYEEREPLRRKAKELWEKGSTQREIGDAINRSQGLARKLLLEAGVDTSKKPPRRQTEAVKRHIERLCLTLHLRETENKTFRQIGEMLNVGSTRAAQIYAKATRYRKRGLLTPCSTDDQDR